MTALRHALHVLRKDLRHTRFMLAGYVALLLFAASSVLGPSTNSPGLFTALGAILSALILATAVQDDDALSAQALWRVRPLAPTGVAISKVLLLGVLLLVGLVVQFAAALAFGASPDQLLALIGRAQWLSVSWLCITLVAASTPDLKRFALVVIFAPIVVFTVVWQTIGRLSASFDETWLAAAITSPFAALSLLALGVALVVLVYRRRLHRVVAWTSAGAVVYVLLWRGMSYNLGGPDTVTLPTDTNGPVLRPALEAAIGFASDSAAILQFTRADRDDTTNAQTDRVVLETGTATLQFADGHTRTVSLANPQRAAMIESSDGLVRSESLIWGRAPFVLQQPSQLRAPSAQWPHPDRTRSRFTVDSLTAGERAEVVGGTVTVRVKGSAISFEPRPAVVVPLVHDAWSSVRGVRAWVRDTSVAKAYAQMIVVQALPRATRVDHVLATAYRNDAPDVLLLNLRTSAVVSTHWNESPDDAFTLVLPGTSASTRRFTRSSSAAAPPSRPSPGSAVTDGRDPLGLAVVGWRLRYRVAVETTAMPVATLREMIEQAPRGEAMVAREIPR